LGGTCSALTATVGIDDEMRGAGSVRFEVWGDGELLFQSDAQSGSSAPLPIEVDVSGVTELHLVASDDGGNGSDHADWADVQVTCSAVPAADCAEGASEIAAPAGYHLVWSDEFDVNGAPNPDNWGFEQGFARNEEAQWYQPDNASVQAGFLIIEGRREQVPNPNYQAGSGDWKKNRQFADYTSSSLHTRDRQSFQYGRFEMRARIVAEAGLWPAFWTLGVAGEWPSCGEIDIMEFYNSRLHANVACGTSTQWQAKWDSASKLVTDFGDADWDAKFHVWRMDWDEQQIALSVDEQQLNTSNLADMLNANGSSPFEQPHYILVNLAIGGLSGGNPANTAFPSRYEVDYVRVFQKD
jgi:beta-glucanase (GH16 family)